MIRLGIIGAGHLGGFHAQKAAQNPHCTLVGIYDTIAETAQTVAEKNRTRPFCDLNQLLDSVDAVILAAPTTKHAEIGEIVLSKKKHLLVEKPITNQASTAKKLADFAQKQGVVLACGHTEQFNPAWQGALPAIESMMTSGPVCIEAKRTSGYTFRSTDVGAAMDLMVHDLELIISLLPLNPNVKKIIPNYDDISSWYCEEFGGFDDTCTAQLKWDDITAHFFVSRVELKAERYITIRSRNKRVTVDFLNRTVEMIQPKEQILSGELSPQKMPVSPLPMNEFMAQYYTVTKESYTAQDALELELKDFLEAIETGREPKVPGKRAADAVNIIQAILELSVSR